MKFKVTARNEDPRLELRGFIDVEDFEGLNDFGLALEPFANVIIVSPIDNDYDPYKHGDPI